MYMYMGLLYSYLILDYSSNLLQEFDQIFKFYFFVNFIFGIVKYLKNYYYLSYLYSYSPHRYHLPKTQFGVILINWWKAHHIRVWDHSKILPKRYFHFPIYKFLFHIFSHFYIHLHIHLSCFLQRFVSIHPSRA